MAPEQIQSCIDACNLCAEACTQQLGALSNGPDSERKDAATTLLRDCAALCRITAAALADVSDAASALCAACAQVCRLCEQEGERDARIESQCRRACLHCAEECGKLASGLPPARALA